MAKNTKIEYEITEGGKSVKKEITIRDLTWGEFCKAGDIAVGLQDGSSKSYFSDIATLIMIYTGKRL